MNFSLKKRLDSIIGTPVLIGLSLLAKSLGAVLRRSHSSHPINTILIMKFQGMGSLAIAKPAIAALRAKYPDAKILFWGTAATTLLAKEMPEFDKIIQLDEGDIFDAVKFLLKTLPELWAIKLDWVFDLEVYSRMSSVLGTLTCARNRAGFAVKTVWYRKNVHTHLVMFNRYIYLGEAYHRLFGLLNTDEDRSLSWSEQRFKFELGRLQEQERPYIVINPHAGELALERRWPIQNFQKLISNFSEKYPNHEILIVGYGREEVELSEYLAAGTKAKSVAGKLAFKETLRLLANADLVISNDTGPLHLALLTQVPVVALFGPTRPESYLPLDRPNTLVLSQRLYCSPCVHHWEPTPCGGDNACMKWISIESVMNASEQLLTQKFSEIEMKKPDTVNAYYAGLIYQRDL